MVILRDLPDHKAAAELGTSQDNWTPILWAYS